MRKPIIAGNWKLNKTSHEAVELVTLLIRDLSDMSEVDIVVCPVFTALADVRDVLNDSNIQLGAQDVFWEDKGAFTGQVSAPFLKDIGCRYVIIGHSERRRYFGETNQTVNKKIKAALEHDLTPIVCVGEKLEEREGNKTFQVIQEQCKESLSDLSISEIQKITIAYEPVWAIGTGKTATPPQAEEAHKFIREFITNMYNKEVALSLRIQYGGSVHEENIRDLMVQPDIDGALIGGASLKAESFIKIVRACLDLKK